jgi:hypothetical protein
MAESSANLAHWLPDARAGSSEALGQVLEACRGYLLVIAEQELEPALQCFDAYRQAVPHVSARP